MRPIYLISKTPHAGVIHIPILSMNFLTPLIDFSRYEGIVLTSKQTLIALRHYPVAWERLQCLCVSEPTAAIARKEGAQNISYGDGYGQSLPALMRESPIHGRWLYPRPKVVASDWVEKARDDGTEIDEVIVYETLCNQDSYDVSIAEDGILIFTSPSTIRCFLERYLLLPTHTVIAIGETTFSALPENINACVSSMTRIDSAIDLAHQIASKR